jgi:hypothetical protein
MTVSELNEEITAHSSVSDRKLSVVFVVVTIQNLQHFCSGLNGGLLVLNY